MAGSYDFEEQERLAAMKDWWDDNGKWLLAAIVAAMLAFGGWKFWQYYGAKKAEDAAAAFEPVSKAAKEKDDKKVEAAAQVLMDRHAGTFYASNAALHAAKAAFDAGRINEARERLEWVLKNGVAEHHGVARIRLAAVLLDDKKYAEALTVLDANKDEAFAAPAADLRGDIMLAQGRIEEARASYKTAMEKADARNPVKNIAEVKLNALGGAK